MKWQWSRGRVVAAGLVSALGLGVLWSYVWGPEFLRKTAVAQLEQALGRRVVLDRVDLDLLRLRVGLSGLTVFERDGRTAFVRVGSLDTQLSWASVRHLAPVVEHLTVQAPSVNLVRYSPQQWNYADIVARMAARPAEPADGGQAQFSINNIRVTQGQLTWVDRLTGARHAITDLGVALPFVSNLPYVAEQFTSPELSARIDGALLTLKGKTRPFAKTRDAELQLNLQGLQLAPFMALVPVKMEANLVRASLDTQLSLVFSQSEQATRLLLQGRAGLRDVLLQDGEGDDLVGWQALDVRLREAEPLKQRWALDRVTLERPVLWLERLKDGRIGLLKAISPSSPSPSPSSAASPERPPVKSALAVSLKTLAVQEGAVHWVDAMVPAGEPARAQDVSAIVLSVQGLAFAEGKLGADPLPVRVSAVHNDHGQVDVSGQVTLPSAGGALLAELDLALKGLELTAAQPYVADRLNVALTRGELSTQGRLTLRVPGGQSPQLTYNGDVSVQGLRSVDKLGGDDFVRWKRLDFKAVKLAFADKPKAHPLDLAIGDIALEDFFARVMVKANGRINLQDIVKSTAQAQADAAVAPASAASKLAVAPTGPAPRIALGRMVLKNGRVDFADNFIKPNYAANLTDLHGTVSAVASDRSKPADVNLRGRIDHDSPLSISGKVHPLSPKLYLQLAARATDIELTRLTPYSAKYAGYPITKGKLSVDLKYLIENGKLDAQNQVYVNQLTFGGKVDSPDATKLPILFAIGLLTNSKGEMDVNLPVAGTLSDPDFSIGGIVWRVIVNLVEKAVTAPFSLLASAFGGDAEELGYVTFAPGSVELSASSRSKLDNMAKILLDRPALKLEIAGRVDPATEQDGAKRAYVNSRIKAQKVAELVKQGQAANSEQVTVSGAEYPRYLEKAYLAEPFDKPRNALGLIKSLSVSEMEALMMKHALVDEMWFKSIADARALAVKRYLDESGRVPVDRLFLVSSRLTAADIKDTGAPQRVDFALAQ